MNSKQFLMIGGVILLALGIIGFIFPNLLGSTLNFDVYENVIHTVLGVVALGAYYWAGADVQKNLVRLVGIIAAIVAIGGFMVVGKASPNFFGANLENPIDNIIHVVVALWGIYVGFFIK
ncbi:hypothetical protein HY065_00630 [Candidatus Berkelbacteria bacterium]|nr:hypothetical protein [Candidatus Berkelbacteria bacterium]